MERIDTPMELIEATMRLRALKDSDTLVTERMIRELDGIVCPLTHEMYLLQDAIIDYNRRRNAKR